MAAFAENLAMSSHRRLFTIVAALVSLAATGCATRTATRSPVHGEIVPKHPHWSNSASRPSNATLMPDPDSLYVQHYRREQMEGRPETMLDGYHFYRFWPDGRLLYRNQMIQGRQPDARDGDTFGYGTLPGRYSVQGNGITLEVFNMLGEYERFKGTLHPQGMILDAKTSKGKDTRYYRVQFPHGAMKKQADW